MKSINFRGNSLAGNAAKVLSGSALYSLLQLATLSVVSRFGGAQDAGDWFFAQAVATPVAFFGSLRLKEQLALDDDRAAYGARVQRMLFVMFPLLLLGSAAWLIFATGQRRYVGIAFLLANLSQQALGAYQGHKARASSFTAPSQLDTALGLLSFAAVVIGYQAERSSLTIGAALTALTWTMLTAFVLTRSVLETRKDLGRTTPRVPLLDDLAVGGAAATQTGQISAARIGAGVFVGQAAISAIGTASFFVRVGVLLVAGLRAALGPRIAEAKSAGVLRQQIVRVQSALRIALLLVSVPAAAVGGFAGPTFIALLFGTDVQPSPATTAIVVAGALFLYGSMILDQLALALDIRRRLAQSTAAALIVTVALLPILAQPLGEPGAAAALTAGYVIRFIVLDVWVSVELNN